LYVFSKFIVNPKFKIKDNRYI